MFGSAADRATNGKEGGSVAQSMKTASAILSALAEKDGEKVTMEDVLAEAGSRAHGFGLLLFALPEALPLPVAGVSAILAIPLLLLSAHLVIFGTGAGIPQRVRGYGIRTSLVGRVTKAAAPVLKKLERLSKPRMEFLADSGRLIGLVCLFLSVVIALPIPFGNLVPAVCLGLIAFGMVERDGLIVAVGLGASALLVVGLYFAIDLITGLFA